MELACPALGRSGQGSRLLLVGSYSLGDGISMDSERPGSFGGVVFVAGEGFLDIELFEFVDCLGQQYVAVEHFINESFQSSAHKCQPKKALRKLAGKLSAGE